MVREAIEAHEAFDDFDLYTKGSYANQTNVKVDSDVDVLVQCREVVCWKEHNPAEGGHPAGTPYAVKWAPHHLREEMKAAREAKFPDDAVTAVTNAVQVDSRTARVDADVALCFTYRHCFSNGTYRKGTKLFKSTGGSIINYSNLQLNHGNEKDVAIGVDYKRAVRILKRLEKVIVNAGLINELCPYFDGVLDLQLSERIFRTINMARCHEGLAKVFNETLRAEPGAEDDR